MTESTDQADSRPSEKQKQRELFEAVLTAIGFSLDYTDFSQKLRNNVLKKVLCVCGVDDV